MMTEAMGSTGWFWLKSYGNSSAECKRAGMRVSRGAMAWRGIGAGGRCGGHWRAQGRPGRMGGRKVRARIPGLSSKIPPRRGLTYLPLTLRPAGLRPNVARMRARTV